MMVQSDGQQGIASDGLQGIGNDGSEGEDKKQRLRQRFQIVKKLGQGTYGKVQLAINKESQQEVAIKTIRKAKIENEQDLLRIRREIQIMASVQHPHIVHIYEVFENCEKIVLIMQYASGGELYEYLGCQKKLSEKEARRLFRQIAAAIFYCHKNKICHRDLKLENILLDNKGNAKIADFGLSNVFDERKKLHTFCGSPLYASPEIVKGTPYCGPEVDCWSLGVLLYTLVYGAMPFDGSNFKRLVKQISEGDYHEPKLKSKASGIIRRLLTVDVATRANIKDVCEDEWVNESYDHSLLKVANDMFCLTPVSLSSLPVLSYANDGTKNNLLKNMCVLRRPMPIDQICNLTLPTRGDGVKEKFTDPDQSNHKIITQTPKDLILASNATNTASFLNSPLQVEASDLALDPQNVLDGGNYDEEQVNFCDNTKMKAVSHDSNTQLKESHLTQTKFLSEKASNFNHQVITSPEVNEHSNECDEVACTNGVATEYFKNTSQSANSKYYENNFNKIITKDNIPNSYLNQNSGRRSTAEQFRAWRANLDKPKSSEPDSILPIFEVTSIIPKRSSERVSQKSNSKEVLNTNVMTSTSKNLATNITSRVISNSYNGNKNGNNNNTLPLSCGQHDEEEIFISERTEHSREKDEMDLLNQTCSPNTTSSSLSVTAIDAELRKSTEDVDFIESIETNAKREYYQLTFDSNESSSIVDHKLENNSIGNTIEDSTCVLMEEIAITRVGARKSIIDPNNENVLPESEADRLPKQTAPISKTEQETTTATENMCDNDVKETVKVINSQVTENCATYELESCDSLQITEPTKVDMAVTKNFRNDNVTNEVNSEFPHGHSITTHKFSTYSNLENEDILCDNNREIVKECPTNTNDGRECRNKTNKFKIRSYSVDNDERLGDLEKILRRPRKYSLCALLAASFEFETLVAPSMKKDSDQLKKVPGKVEIPKSFDPSLESELINLVEKKEFLLIPSISVAENKQKIEKKIEKVKLSALSMKPRRRSEASAKRKLKKYTRSSTDVLQYLNNLSDTVNIVQSNIAFGNDNTTNCSLRSSECEFNNLRNSMTEIGNFYSITNTIDNDMYTNSLENIEPLHMEPVPITRCCKKITFPSKYIQTNKNSTLIMQENGIQNINSGFSFERKQPENCIFQNTEHKKLRRKIKGKKNIPKTEVEFENQDNPKDSSESLLSSSFEKDSSDNDDELDTMIFNTTLDDCDSGDLWKFLKTVNSQLNHRNKKVKRCNPKSMFSRSKSQECRMPDKRHLKDKLTRSQSKEEKSTTQTIDSDFCDAVDEYSSFAPLEQQTRSFGYINDFFKNRHSDFKTNKSFSYKNSDGKYSSLNDLDDSRRFLNECNLSRRCKINSVESWENMQNGVNEYSGVENGCDSSDVSLQTQRIQSLYATIRPSKLNKSKRSQSSMTLNSSPHELGGLKTMSQADLNYGEPEHSKDKRNKALSDMDIRSNGMQYAQEFYRESNGAKFSKSLGSKLDFTPRGILVDSQCKQRSLARKHDEKHKKRERRVSFMGESMKNDHANFLMESLAKAQTALTNVERSVPESDISDDHGTLLEALKTHGYNFIMSQRLQQNELESESLNKRYSIGNMINVGHYRNNELQFSFPYSNDVLNTAEYTNRLRWNRNLLSSFDDMSHEFDELEYSDLINLNDLYNTRTHFQTDTNWCKLPNMWLYQNIDELKSHPPLNQRIPTMKRNDLDESLLPRQCEPQLFAFRYKDINEACLDVDDVPTSSNCDMNLTHENEFSRSLESPIEKLSLKLKALKSRCQQKKYDDSFLRNGESSSMVENSENKFETNGIHETDSTSHEHESNPRESVSDRIWRKSFYSRFNDKSTPRRRRSTLLDSDLSFSKYSLSHSSIDSESSSNLDQEPTYARNDVANSFGESRKEHSTSEQNIPNN